MIGVLAVGPVLSRVSSCHLSVTLNAGNLAFGVAWSIVGMRDEGRYKMLKIAPSTSDQIQSSTVFNPATTATAVYIQQYGCFHLVLAIAKVQGIPCCHIHLRPELPNVWAVNW